MAPSVIRVINLGRQHYRDALAIQERCRKQVIGAARTSTRPHNLPSNCSGYLILVEHHPVYTLGLRQVGWSAEDEQKLRLLGADFCRTNRGGLVTFHGPGQLVAYPIVHLQAYGKGLRWYVCQLERTVVDAVQRFGVQAGTTAQTGVWVDGRKLASIGVHASQFVTMHGVALNCNVDLRWFEHIVPCGIEGVQMTSLSKELGRDVDVQATADHFLSSFGSTFQCKLESADATDLAGLG